MLDKILNKIGLVRKSIIGKYRDLEKEPFTEQELSFMLAEILGNDPWEFNEAEEERMFSEAKKVDGLIEYLKTTAINDKNRYFGASTPQEQLVIRGSFARTNYIKGRIINAGKNKDTKIKGIRYE